MKTSMAKLLLFIIAFYSFSACQSDSKKPISTNGSESLKTDSLPDTPSVRGYTYAEFVSTVKVSESQQAFLPKLWELWKAEEWTTLESVINQPNDTLNYGYPPANGFISMELVTLPVGKKLDRYGYLGGSFVADEGASFGSRSLKPSSKKSPYYTFIVTKDIPNVAAGLSIPWFGQPGMGMQYNFSDPIDSLVAHEYLKVTSVVQPK